MKTILIALTFFTAGYVAKGYEPAAWHGYDTAALGNITAMYAPIAPLNKADCIDCGGL